MYFTLILTYLISFIGAIPLPIIITKFASHIPLFGKVKKLFEISIPSGQLDVSNLRGKNYYVGTISDPIKEKALKSSPITFWTLSHVALYTILGIMFPTQCHICMLVGGMFEVLEWKCWNCGDWIDLIANFSGWFIGWSFRKFISFIF